jgi:Tfp pilus assembly protein PilF
LNLGRPLLKKSPEDFFLLATLTEAGYEDALAGHASLSTETVDYARRAIAVLEAGQVTQADPFKSIEVARGFLNSALGWFLKDQSPVEAAAAFLNAAKSDSPYRTDPSIYRRLGVAILKGEFAQLSAEYNEKFGGKPPSKEQTAMYERVTHVAERAIDAYARAVALSTGPEQHEAKSKILVQLTALYKNFHNNSDAGLSELISTVLSKPLP